MIFNSANLFLLLTGRTPSHPESILYGWLKEAEEAVSDLPSCHFSRWYGSTFIGAFCKTLLTHLLMITRDFETNDIASNRILPVMSSSLSLLITFFFGFRVSVGNP